ncbi:hypothetical protein [Amycolatopsis nigrescens]|uniref:hypothetical protein n=1 Tax=Amycolatopsis nigrescens TaxID=381445 RepID=UPI00036EFCEB|nr:hypothetical protein [Amycolatopsis nigrescens]
MATFLPMTIEAARGARAKAVLREAGQTDAAAGECWTALLAGCARAGAGLDVRLRRLSEATSVHVGTKWWFTEGAAHRRRVARAQSDIEEALAEGDGQEFARAFVGYDHAMASAVVCAGGGAPRTPRESGRTKRTRSPTA